MPNPAAGINNLVVELNVIVLSYNHPEITARTISSLSPFTFKNIYLIHNGSTDTHKDKLINDFPDIHHVVLPMNLGFTGGANAGFTEAYKTADWCLFLTNDCILENIGQLPLKPAIIAPKIMSRNTKNIDSIAGYYIPQKGLLRHYRREEEFYTNTDIKYVPGTGFILHKDIFIKTNGFDTSLFTYWEDVDFSIRLQQFGYQIYIDPDWRLRHYIGKTCHKNPLYTIYYYQRNRLRISKKYTRGVFRLQLIFFVFKDLLKLVCKLLTKKRYKDVLLLWTAIKES